jgi:hypothetical protein
MSYGLAEFLSRRNLKRSLRNGPFFELHNRFSAPSDHIEQKIKM